MELVSNVIIRVNDNDFALYKRIKLLKQIDKVGSILQAAKEVPMSYKSAWDAIDMMNNLSDKPVIERKAGGRYGGGSKLTEFGRNLVKIYDKIDALQDEFIHIIEQNTDINSVEILNLQRIAMQISARNVFLGEIVSIKQGAINSDIVLKLKGGVEIASIITSTSAENLGLEVGKKAKAIIKSSSVMIANNKDIAISARNILEGSVTNIVRGKVNCEISLDIGSDQILTGVITLNSIDKLGLEVGKKACGIIKSSEVMIGL
ncbi:MAG: TOBE domain-containing protein [Campylobacter sp.]|nr:TOBE domain-containing protein [Campylobacter sp.]